MERIQSNRSTPAISCNGEGSKLRAQTIRIKTKIFNRVIDCPFITKRVMSGIIYPVGTMYPKSQRIISKTIIAPIIKEILLNRYERRIKKQY